MSDWGWNLHNLVRTRGAERYWFVGEVIGEEASEVRRPLSWCLGART